MDKGVLVGEKVAAGIRFIHLFQKRVPIQSAFWLKHSEERYLRLYIVSEQITDANFDVFFSKARDIAYEMDDPWFDPEVVWLIGADTPLAKAVRELRERYYPGRKTIHQYEVIFGGVSADELWIYPTPLPSPPQ
jgi:hypothetical protein